MLRPPLHNSSAPRDKEPTETDKILKWQQERLERKLRGEYESAVLHLSEVINGNLKTPVNISAVRVEGALHTRKTFLGEIVAADAGNAATLEDVLHASRRISHGLRKTDIFTSIEAFIDRPRDPLAHSGDVDLVFKTKERGRWYVSSSTELGNNEGSAVCILHHPPMFFRPLTFYVFPRLLWRVSAMYLVGQKPSRLICPLEQKLDALFVVYSPHHCHRKWNPLLSCLRMAWKRTSRPTRAVQKD